MGADKAAAGAEPDPAAGAAMKAGAKNRSHGKSEYFGVSLKYTNSDGGQMWVAQVNRKDDKWMGDGMFDSEELAAAAVQDHLRHPTEAARLRALHEKKVAGEMAAEKPAAIETAEKKAAADPGSEPAEKAEAGKLRRGRRSASGHLGVIAGGVRKGRQRWTAQIQRKGSYWRGWTFDSKELAAAAVQEHLGKPVEADRLRKLHEHISGEKLPAAGLAENPPVMCGGCGQSYETEPEKCSKCNGHSFEPTGLAAFVAAAAE